MSAFPVTPRTKLKRAPQRGIFERPQVYQILDEALICHMGFSIDEQPYVIPTIHARVGDRLYIHGSAASRMLRHLKQGVQACVTVTLLDGLVLARSAFHHSMNYRSVVMLGTMEEVTDLEEKSEALDAIVEQVMKGRTQEARGANAKELKATSVLVMQLEEASAKVRTGGPIDDEEDYSLPIWAGVIPTVLQPSAPIPDSRLAQDIPLPNYVQSYLQNRGIA